MHFHVAFHITKYKDAYVNIQNYVTNNKQRRSTPSLGLSAGLHTGALVAALTTSASVCSGSPGSWFRQMAGVHGPEPPLWG